jgi:hypothetical protein
MSAVIPELLSGTWQELIEDGQTEQKRQNPVDEKYRF